MSDFLMHHGIKGQKWGVRRFQNPDGSLTDEGRKRVTDRRRISSSDKTRDDVNRILSTMSENDNNMLDLQGEYIPHERGKQLAHRVLLKDGDTPTTFFDLLTYENSSYLWSVVATDPAYRGKGQALRAAQKGKDWFDKYGGDFAVIRWAAFNENQGSLNTAKKLGFKVNKDMSDDSMIVYEYNKQKPRHKGGRA